MPQFAANLSMLYPELDFLDRFEAAARDGFKAVEYLFPYAYGGRSWPRGLQANGLQQVLFNAPPGGSDPSAARAWDAGDKGLACLPGREAEFREGIARALDYAAALACPRLHVMAGLVPAGQPREAAPMTYLWPTCATPPSEAAKQGVDVLIEPINTRDIPASSSTGRTTPMPSCRGGRGPT
jgi:hydroxypyruvate isomerase